MLPLLRRSGAQAATYGSAGPRPLWRHVQQHCGLLTLAIESSCDDTSVAILEKHDAASPLASGIAATVHFNEKVTANNDAYNGIHPLVALESHQRNLAPLVQDAIKQLPRRPDFVSVTRGPGMRSNLSVGLDTAKGLALAWEVPLLGVHHMQAHALTSRLVHTLRNTADEERKPAFPFLSVLASGGHTMLIKSSSLTQHNILAETGDIALGDCLDKSARVIVPHELLRPPYGRALEHFAFPNRHHDYHYAASSNRAGELERKKSDWGWSLRPPMAESKGGRSSKRMAYSFAGILSSVDRFMKYDIDLATLGSTKTPRKQEVVVDERRDLAREVQRVAFEHLAGRIILYLQEQADQPTRDQITTVVVSGGVASNYYLRYILRAMLDARLKQKMELEFPPVELCTDNALMIAWTGIEMWEAGYRSDLSIRPIRKWSVDSSSDDGGITGVEGWKHSAA